MGSVENRAYRLVKKPRQNVQTLLEGIVVHQKDLGELGKTLENMMRLAGVQPSWEHKPSRLMH